MKILVEQARGLLEMLMARRRELARLAGFVSVAAGLGVLSIVFFLGALQAEKTRQAKKLEVEAAQAGGSDFLPASDISGILKHEADFRAAYIKQSQVASILNDLSEKGKKNNVRIVSVYSGKPSQELLPIYLKLEADYVSLVEFLESLTAARPVFLVETLHIAKKQSEAGQLACEMTLNFLSNP